MINEIIEWLKTIGITNFNFINTLIHLIGTISPILMRTNTKRFNFLKYPSVIAFLLIGFLSYYFRISVVVSSTLILHYSIMVSFGIIFFMRKYDYLKAISLSIALSFAASGIWELPIIVYSIIYKGYIDGAFPLHIIYLLPLLLLQSDIKFKNKSRPIVIAVMMMTFNCLMLVLHIQIHGAHIWSVSGFYENILLWFSRPITVIALYAIYYGGELKRSMMN